MKRFVLAVGLMSLLAVLVPAQAEAQRSRAPSNKAVIGLDKPQQDAPADGGAGRIRKPMLFALGDSSASGEGDNTLDYEAGTATDVDGSVGAEPNVCHRSNNSYAALLSPNFIDTEFVACSGASIGILDSEGQYDERPQFDAFTNADNTESPRIITVGIGVNDVGFVSTLAACASSDACHEDDELTDSVDGVLDTIQAEYERLYLQILDHPENADTFTAIVAVGYPHLFGTGDCPTAPLDVGALYSIDERKWMDERADKLNYAIKSAVDTVASAGHRVYFADIAPVLEGHEACGADVVDGDPTTQWLNAFDLSVFSHSFHPNEHGHARMAEQIANVIYGEVLRFV